MPRNITEFFKQNVTVKEEPEEVIISYLDQSKELKQEKIDEPESPAKKSSKINSQNQKSKKPISKAAKLKKCQFCSKDFHPKSIHSHIRSKHASECFSVPCEICGNKYSDWKYLKIHLQRKHKILQSNFECDYCGKVFASKKSLRTHIRTHLGYICCKICDAEVKVFSIKYHLRHFHGTDKEFQCRFCSKSFKTKDCLKLHENAHDKKFECKYCPKKFPSLGTLNQHQREVHENPKSIKCPECGKAFNRNWDYKVHMRIHDKTHKKRFKCDKCDKFSTDYHKDLKKHEIAHKNLEAKIAAMKNPSKCPTSVKYSKDENTLKKHIYDAHEQPDVQCDLCGDALKFKSLPRHMELHLRGKFLNKN